MTEHDFIRSIHRKLSKEIYVWKIHDTYAGGVPDAFYSGPAGILFIEYKYFKELPKRDTTRLPIKVSQLQIEWLNRASTCPMTVALVIGSQKSGIILKKDFTNNISKQYYAANKVDVQYIVQWIERITLTGQDNGFERPDC